MIADRKASSLPSCKKHASPFKVVMQAKLTYSPLLVRLFLACLFALTVAGLLVLQVWPASELRFSARIQLQEQPEHQGSPGGTILDIQAGKASVLAIGFMNSYSTHSQRNDLFLTLTSYSNLSGAKLQSIGKPFPESGSYLSRVGRFLVAHPITRAETKTHWLFDTQTSTWSSLQRQDLAKLVGFEQNYPADCGELFAINRANAFTWRCMIQAPSTVLTRSSLPLELTVSDAQIVPFFVTHGLAVFSSFSSDRSAHIAYCRLNSRDQRSRMSKDACTEHKLENLGEFPYAIWQVNGAVLAATNWGNVLRYNLMTREIVVERKSDGRSFQIYTAMHHQDKVLLGEFPRGAILEYVDQLRMADKQLPLDAYRNATGAEVQVLMGYAGRIFAGVWPFGELHVMDPVSGEWSLKQRLFNGPAISRLVPFEEVVGNNILGQRVGDMLVVGDSMYIATSSKQGGILKPSDFPSVPTDMRDSYGEIWRLRAPGTLAIDVAPAMRASEDILVELRGNRLTLSAGGKLLGETTFEPDAIGCGSVTRRDEGFFGPLVGLKAHVQVTHNTLSCQ